MAKSVDLWQLPSGRWAARIYHDVFGPASREECIAWLRNNGESVP